MDHLGLKNSRTHINIDAEEIGVANTLHTRLSSAEEEARTAPSHEACQLQISVVVPGAAWKSQGQQEGAIKP